MTEAPIRIGLVGCGVQASREYLPLLRQREESGGNVKLVWVSGYLPEHEGNLERDFGVLCLPHRPVDAWKDWIAGDAAPSLQIDAAIVSLPNVMHGDAVVTLLCANKHVAVDKPTALDADLIDRMCSLAERRKRVLMTIAQRRYEDIYLKIADLLRDGHLGTPIAVEYLIAHDDFGARHDATVRTGWQWSRSISGGGVLLHSGYHGIDVILWLLKQVSPACKPVSVSCQWLHEPSDAGPDCTEIAAHASIRLEPGPCLLSVTALNRAPTGSIDEEIKIYGTAGCVRMIRHRTGGRNRSAGTLSFQATEGPERAYDTSRWVGRRTAPVEDFFAMIRSAERGFVADTARDSAEVMRIINAAYKSAAHHGELVTL